MNKYEARFIERMFDESFDESIISDIIKHTQKKDIIMAKQNGSMIMSAVQIVSSIALVAASASIPVTIISELITNGNKLAKTNDSDAIKYLESGRDKE